MSDNTELVPLENPDPRALFVPGGLAAILERIEEQARSVVPDISTAKGRASVASTAAKVAKAKTYLDGIGKDYVTQLKALPGQVDAERREMRDRLDRLRDEVRAPLTEWETAEAQRETTTQAILVSLLAPVQMGTSAKQIVARLEAACSLQIPNDLHQKQQERILAAMDDALPRLQVALDAATAAEAQAAELDRLRAETAERARKDREEQIAREAAEAATKRAEERAQQERQDAERRGLEALAAAEARVAAAERQATAIAAAERERTADHKHRERIHAAVARAIATSWGMSLDEASGIVRAIVSGDIPHLSITY